MSQVAPFLKATSIAPILPVTNVDQALERFTRLGFKTTPYRDSPDSPAIYGFASFGAGELHVICVDHIDPLTTTSACYLYVEDVIVVFDAWSRANVEGRLHPPVDTPYGLREMAYTDPDGNLIRVGLPLEGNQGEHATDPDPEAAP